MKVTKNEHPEYDIETYPPDLQPILEILWNAEEHLSDGFSYYCGEGERYRRTMAALATALRDAALKTPQVKALVSEYDPEFAYGMGIRQGYRCDWCHAWIKSRRDITDPAQHISGCIYAQFLTQLEEDTDDRS